MDENPNNNADFDPALESVMKPVKKLTLGQFVDAVQNLAEAMLDEQEDSTGEFVEKSWDEWIDDLNVAHLTS